MAEPPARMPQSARPTTPRVRGAARHSQLQRAADAHAKTPTTSNAWAGSMQHDPRVTEAIMRGAGQAELDRITDRIRPEYEQARVKQDWLRAHVTEDNARTQQRTAERQAASDAAWQGDVDHSPEAVDCIRRGDWAGLAKVRAQWAARRGGGDGPDHTGSTRIRM